MLREYLWRGSTWQFEEADAPADAVPVGDGAGARAGEPKAEKAAATKANKARRARNRAAADETEE